MAEAWQKLIEVLRVKNIVKPKALNDAIERFSSSGEAVEKVLVKSGLITREQLLDCKREAFQIEPYDLNPKAVDPRVGQLLPQTMAERYGVVCVEHKDNVLTLVSTEPLDAIAADYVRMRSGFEIRFRLSYAADVEEARQLIYAATPTSLRKEFYTLPSRASEPALRSRGPMHEVAASDIRRKTIPLPGVEWRGEPAPVPSAKTRVTARAVHEAPLKKGARAAAMRADVPRVVPLSPKAACALCSTTSELNRDLETHQQLHKVVQTVTAACDCEAASLLVLDSDGRSLYCKAVVGSHAASLLNVIVPLNEASVAGWVLGHRKSLIVNDTDVNPLHNKETDRMLEFATRRVAAAPVMWGNTLLGVLEAVDKRTGGFSEGDLDILTIASAQAAVALHNESTAAQLSGLVMETVNVLAEMLQMHGKVSHAHLLEVAQLATAMGREAGLGEEDLEILSHAGILHDIGIIAQVGDADESLHLQRGAELLSRIPMLANLVPYIRMHHERWDGGGPMRLREAMIPLPARILAIAEAWCERKDDDVETFLGGFGKIFDPALREAFVRAHRARYARQEQEAPR